MNCEHCGKPLPEATGKRRRPRQFCSDTCRVAAWRKRRDIAAEKRAEDVLPSRNPKPGYIYFLEGGGNYKIGKTKDLLGRTKFFNLRLPFNVVLAHTIQVADMVWAEKYLHRVFDHSHINGEWFKLQPDDIDWICALDTLEYGAAELSERF